MLTLHGGSNTIMLPSSIFMFGEISKLELVGQLRLSNEEGTGQGSSSASSSTTRDFNLDLPFCNISDKLLEKFLAWFPNVQHLNLSGSSITILPECIRNCSRLKFLEIPDCKNLKEIRGIPPNVKSLNASGSTSLSCSSRELLLNKELHESVGEKIFILSGTSIPSWFELQRSGHEISFWFRNKFPAISVCFVIPEAIDDFLALHVPYLFAKNCSYCWLLDRKNDLSVATTDHTWIYDLEDHTGGSWFAQNEWHQAKVYLSPSLSDEPLKTKEMTGIKMGVHINGKRSSMGDIQFTDDHEAPLEPGVAGSHLKPNHVFKRREGCSYPRPSKFQHYQPRRPVLFDHPISPFCTCVPIENDPGANAIFTTDPDLVLVGPSESSNNTSCSGKAREGEEEEEVYPISTFTESSTSSIDTYLSNKSEKIVVDDDDDEMGEFYASVSFHEKLVTAAPSDEETRKALRSVKDLLSKDASIFLLNPEMCSTLRANLIYLSKLSAEDRGGISIEMSQVISEASRFWAERYAKYTKARTKYHSTMSHFTRAGDLELNLESTKKQLNVIRANMSDSQSKAGKGKKEILEEKKTIKAVLVELKKNVPQWEHDYTSAKKSQATIIAEWSKLQEKFQNIEELGIRKNWS
ncbi:hypothetical protein PIB30_031728 [Stylosanthes scabra]|uniref:Disease resistance protein RPS4B/Roq1-like leucine-rich repeats domain-containing protein n=1 Tax=Stylosanthes scabra TaxID=79078 RepID=A0ABU6TBP8_9FABA|nr:hypothetical protein [Stylosanthes scabra]